MPTPRRKNPEKPSLTSKISKTLGLSSSSNKNVTKNTKSNKNQASMMNNPYFKEFEHIKKEVKKAYNKLEKDLKNHADPKVLQNDNNRLFLLLGECHYIARQCWSKMNAKKKK